MQRRAYLGAVVGTGVVATAGCLDGLRVSTDFDLVDPQLASDASPDIALEGDTVTARGTVQYGSSRCGTVELAHAKYENSQDRLDLLVVAANDYWRFGACTDDLVETGYRLEARVHGGVRRATITEHDVFGEAYSASVEE
ncbi:hypothetical protein [Natrononativus amylolyticus]|uniref:hypothetical protein n=1 Tax=Natrononativus amylolyticus TaxID=2963434 RepID=UPI0020CDFE8C|nr:hypothetical protein [Natrononativus amylolyticus]